MTVAPDNRDRALPSARWREEGRATLALAWPIVLANLLQFGLALTDALLLGRLGTEALAAALLGVNLFWVSVAPVIGLAAAATPLLAQARGAGRRGGGAGRGWVREMRRSARQAVWATLLCVPPIAVLLWQTEAILLLARQEPALAALGGAYMRAMAWGVPFIGLFLVLRSFLAAMERPRPALWVSAGVLVLNALLGIALIFWAGLGVVGAGIASSIANAASALALLALIQRDRVLRRFRILGRFWRPDRARLAEVFRVGLPIAGAMVLEIGVFAAAGLVVGWWGTVAVAAHAIVAQVSAMTFMVPMGIGQAATARVGLAAGAGDAAGIARAGRVAIVFGAGFMALAAVALVLGAEAIALAFLDQGDPQAPDVAVLGASLLLIAALYQLADGVQAVAGGALRGLKDTRVPMLLAALGYWVLGLPLGLLLAGPAGLGPQGVWFGLAAGLGIVAVLMLRRWRRLVARWMPGDG